MTHEIAKNALSRCTVIMGGERCPYECAQSSRVCPLHQSERFSNTLVGQMRYNIADREMAERFKNGPDPKSLADEVVLLRVMLQKIWTAIEKDETNPTHALLQNESKITNIISQIDRLVTNTHRIEKSLGNLLDQSQVLDMMTQVVTAIEDNLSDHPEKMEAIAKGIGDIMSKPLTSFGIETIDI